MSFQLTSEYVYEYREVWKQQNQAIVNILHLRLTNEDGDVYQGTADSQVVMAAMHGLWVNILTPIQTENLIAVESRILRVDNATPVTPSSGNPYIRVSYGPEDFIFYTSPDAGDLADPPLPTYVAATIRKFGLTENNARVFGSMRIGGLTEASTGGAGTENGNELGVGALGVISSFAQDLTGTVDLGDDTWAKPGILSLTRAVLQQPLANIVGSFAPITSASVNKLVGSQVSRKQSNALQ